MKTISDEALITLLKSLPKEVLQKALGTSITKSKKSTKVQAEVIYNNHCLFCDNKWTSKSPADFVGISPTNKPIGRTFSHCSKCEDRLTRLDKESIIHRALYILKDKYITSGGTR